MIVDIRTRRLRTIGPDRLRSTFAPSSKATRLWTSNPGTGPVDIRLLADVDDAYGQMSGLATREVRRRQFEVFA